LAKSEYPSRGRARLPLAGLLAASLGFLAFLLGGCSLGPINLESGTPVPTSTPTLTPTPSTKSLGGAVLDAYTNKPIAGAEVTAGNILTETTSAGEFAFDDVPIRAKLVVSADGYAKADLDTPIQMTTTTLKLRPTTLKGKVTDSANGEPLAGVLVKLMLPEGQAAPATPTEAITGTVLPAATATTSTLRLQAGLAAPVRQEETPVDLFRGDVEPAPTQADAVINDPPVDPQEEETPTEEPEPASPTKTALPALVPPTGQGFISAYTDAKGEYSFKDVPEGANLTFKMPGYKLTKVPVGQTTTLDKALDPFKAEAIYVTANYAASPDLFDPLIEFAQKSRINSIVLNVQNDASEWVFDVKNKDVLDADNTDEFLKEMPDVVKKLKEKGFYVIARVVTFQQKKMAEARPDWAVKSSESGKPWKGGYMAQQRWLDASNPAAQDHLIDMTKEVLQLGFDEIQYDYVRFPSDPAPSEGGDMVFATMPLTDTGKMLALQQFFKKAHDVIEPTDAFMSADVFGYTLWPDRDGEPILGVIGQVPHYLLPYTDYLCPMIYPSHFSTGEQGCDDPAACAYELVKKSGEYATEIFKGQRAKYRPWLQDFDWGVTDYTSPGTTKVADQIKAAKETNAWGWQWWDASNQYQPRAAFK